MKVTEATIPADEACGIAPGLGTGQVDGTTTSYDFYAHNGLGKVPDDRACGTEVKILNPEAMKVRSAFHRESQRNDPWFRQQIMQLALGSFAGERAKADELVAAATKILDWVAPPSE